MWVNRLLHLKDISTHSIAFHVSESRVTVSHTCKCCAKMSAEHLTSMSTFLTGWCLWCRILEYKQNAFLFLKVIKELEKAW